MDCKQITEDQANQKKMKEQKAKLSAMVGGSKLDIVGASINENVGRSKLIANCIKRNSENICEAVAILETFINSNEHYRVIGEPQSVLEVSREALSPTETILTKALGALLHPGKNLDLSVESYTSTRQWIEKAFTNREKEQNLFLTSLNGAVTDIQIRAHKNYSLDSTLSTKINARIKECIGRDTCKIKEPLLNVGDIEELDHETALSNESYIQAEYYGTRASQTRAVLHSNVVYRCANEPDVERIAKTDLNMVDITNYLWSMSLSCDAPPTVTHPDGATTIAKALMNGEIVGGYFHHSNRNIRMAIVCTQKSTQGDCIEMVLVETLQANSEYFYPLGRPQPTEKVLARAFDAPTMVKSAFSMLVNNSQNKGLYPSLYAETRAALTGLFSDPTP
jgi:hypothetical protein